MWAEVMADCLLLSGKWPEREKHQQGSHSISNKSPLSAPQPISTRTDLHCLRFSSVTVNQGLPNAGGTHFHFSKSSLVLALYLPMHNLHSEVPFFMYCGGLVLRGLPSFCPFQIDFLVLGGKNIDNDQNIQNMSKQLSGELKLLWVSFFLFKIYQSSF